MTNFETRVDEARARVHALLGVRSAADREGSQIALMFEFLRRSAQWSTRLELAWPWQSVADAVALGTPHGKQLAELRADVEPTLRDLPFVVRTIALNYLDWCALEALAADALVLPSPYEPAMRMLERGPPPTIENGMFQFALAGFPMRRPSYYLDKAPYTGLDAESLDRHDIEWRHEHPPRS